jgi:hypothetical protein
LHFSQLEGDWGRAALITGGGASNPLERRPSIDHAEWRASPREKEPATPHDTHRSPSIHSEAKSRLAHLFTQLLVTLRNCTILNMGQSVFRPNWIKSTGSIEFDSKYRRAGPFFLFSCLHRGLFTQEAIEYQILVRLQTSKFEFSLLVIIRQFSWLLLDCFQVKF